MRLLDGGLRGRRRSRFRARLVVIAGHQIPALAAWGRRIGLHGVRIEHFLLTPGLAEPVRSAGLSVTTGTVNHGAPGRLVGLGLDAITSDAPHELRAELHHARAVAVAR